MYDHEYAEKVKSREELHEWEKWVEIIYKNVPAFDFGPGFQIKIVPPVGGAMVRMLVYFGSANVSIFLDAHNELNGRKFLDQHQYYNDPVEQAYWEIYPYHDPETDTADDIKRYGLFEIDTITEDIKRTLQFLYSNSLKGEES